MPVQFKPHSKNAQDPQTVALSKMGRYSLDVAANSVTGLGNPLNNRRNSAPITIAGAFFASAYSFYGGCAWETFGSAGVLYARSVNLRTAATLIRLTANRGSFSTIGAPPMTTLISSKIRALAHRRMALSALRADSSLSVRLKRYNDHMIIVRALEVQGGAE